MANSTPSLVEVQVRRALRELRENYKTSGLQQAWHRSSRNDTMLIIIWSMYQGWSMAYTGRQLKCTAESVAKLRRAVSGHPQIIFMFPVLYQGILGSSRKPLFKCLLCGNLMPTTELKARTHVALHVVTREAIAMYGVMPG